MATANSVQTMDVSESGRVHVGNNFYHSVPERPETPPKPSMIIPFRRDDDFVKREAILDRLHQACLKPASRAALVGLRGLGKSQLAIEYAYRVRDMFRQKKEDIWVFWVHASTRARVEEGFKTIADAVKIPNRNQPNANIPQLVSQWLQNERNGRWFMILDSADCIDVFYDVDEKAKQTATVDGKNRALSTYLPQSSNGSILVTTTSKELAFRLTGAHRNIIEVGPMDHDHALELLATKLGSHYDKEDGAKLAEALEYMPLVISQAAAYIQEGAPLTSLKKYLHEFQTSDRNKSRLLNHDAGDLRRDGSASNSVIKALHISLDYIHTRRPSATDLLSLMSFFDCQGIQEYLVRPTDQNESCDDEACSDSGSIASRQNLNHEFERDITTLRNYSLITTNPAGNAFEMHGLVQLSTRKWLDIYGETEKFKEQFISRMAQAFPSGEFETWGVCRQLVPHAEKAIDYRPINKEALIEWAQILLNAGWFSLEQGKYTIAETMTTIARDAGETALGPEHPETLFSLHILAITYERQGQWKEAELLNMQVMEIRKRVLGPEHPDTLWSMHTLALTYGRQRQWKKAELLHMQVIEIRKRVLGPEHLNTLISMNSLASAYGSQERWKEAESLDMQVMEISKRVLGPEHPDTLSSMHSLALTYERQRQWKEAELLYMQVMEIRKRVLGPEHPNTLSSMDSLASAYGSQGQLKEAELLHMQVIEIRKRVLGPEHPDTLSSMDGLASAYRSQRQLKEAELLHMQVMEIRKRVLGPEHPHTLSSMNNLACTWNSQGRTHDALELMEQCYQKRIRVLGPEHPNTQKSLSAIQDWRIEESQASESRRKPTLKNAIVSIRMRFREVARRQDSEGE
ncbi:P-loop containing nucleoside triphosphate hydrolase protein [Xylaria sp. FL1777]|nr:P-loop containing nucleoside triphosphate hydrolase protein [Xylaria sp. FL1777]